VTPVPAPLRLVIVDDEPLARARAKRILATLPGAEVVGEAANAAEAREVIAVTRPDALLLDVQMPGPDGFELLAGLSPRPAVVFVTAYDQYAVRAFEANAVDYLLKPYRPERLAAALERLRGALARPEELSRRLEELLAAVGPGVRASEYLERFTVRLGLKQLIVRAEDVFWFGAEDKLVFAAVEGNRHYVAFTLDELERRLDPRRFARVHRSAIANLDQSVTLRPGFAGTWRLQMADAERTEVPVSRVRARALRSRLGAR
jgi:two-component system LytT family response regulator